METAVVLARIAEYAAGAALFGTPLFLAYALPASGASSPGRLGWPRPFAIGAALAFLIAAFAYLLAQTATMAGDPAAAQDPQMLESVLTAGAMGAAIVARGAAAALALVLAAALRAGRPLWLTLSALGAVALASLAWTGHGGADEGLRGVVHVTADVLHLLAAGAWVGALFGFALLLARPRRIGAEAAAPLHRALHGFSGVGSAAVAVIVATGLVNSWLLVGPAGVGQLFVTAYGQLLLVKLAAFAGMLLLAARNRFRHTPALGEGVARGETTQALAALRRSVLLETGLGLLVLTLVGVLGMLQPIATIG